MSIADQLITRGWAQDQLIDDTGAVCLDGAACLAAGMTIKRSAAAHDLFVRHPVEGSPEAWEQYHRNLDALADAIHAETGLGGGAVPWWNDNRCESADQALRVAKLADQILEAGQ